MRLTLARLQMSASAFDKAIPVLRQLLADEPWLPQGVAMLAQAYTESGQSADAIALLAGARSRVEPAFYETLGEAYEKDKPLGRRRARLRAGVGPEPARHVDSRRAGRSPC